MWCNIVFLLTCLSQLILASESMGMPPSISNVINNHFRKGEGTNLYFCRKRDTLIVLKKCLNQPENFQITLLDSSLNSYLNMLSFMTLQRVGIFLDLTCIEGLDFLRKNSNFFNGTFRWLIWTNDFEKAKEILHSTRLMVDSDVTVGYQSDSNVILLDIFRMHSTLPFISTEIQKWIEERGLIHIQQPPSRINFQGIKLTGSLLLIHTVINKTEEIPLLLDPLYLPGVDGNRRYCFTLFTHLAEFYNFTYKYIYSDVWGYPQINGGWSGMVGQVARSEADVGLSAVHFSIKRSKVTDFVGCMDFTRVCFSFLQPKLFGSYKALILPLDKSIWICLFVISVTATFVFRIASYYDDTSDQNDSWGGSFLLVLGAISQQGIADGADKLATRLAHLSLLIVSLLAVSYYNTSILNGLLLPAPNAIQNMDQLLASGFKVATSNSKYLLYDMTLNDSLTERIRQKMLKSKFSNDGIFTIKDGVELVKKGGFALYIMAKEAYPEMHNKFTAAEICSLSEINKYRPLPTGGIVSKNSPLREIFNRKFTMMRESGLMTRGKLLWNPRKPECNWKQDSLEIGAEPLFLSYLVLTIGMLTSLIFLAVECYKGKGIKKNSHLSKLFVNHNYI